MAKLTIDGRSVEAPEGALLLEAVRRADVNLPTLCYWEGLPPYGACRLCLVEVTAPQRQVVAACAYPAVDGLEVDTQGPAAMAARRIMLELLLARRPSSKVLAELATGAGVSPGRLEPLPGPGDGNELCILCGLCVRVCRDLVGAAAIGFIGRGAGRSVGPPFRVQAGACIGCGACAGRVPDGCRADRGRGRPAQAADLEHYGGLAALPRLRAAVRPRAHGLPARPGRSLRRSLGHLSLLPAQACGGATGCGAARSVKIARRGRWYSLVIGHRGASPGGRGVGAPAGLLQCGDDSTGTGR